MSKCDFSISVTKQKDEIRKLIKNEISNEGGNISFSNDREGKFDLAIPGGKIAGDITIQNQEVQIEITHKPTMIPCGIIETVIKSYL